MNHTYRVLTFLLCFMVFNSWAETPLTIEEDLFTTCADRTASNTTRCMNDDYVNIRYGGYILFKGLENHYKLRNGRFQEFMDGTARLTGQWVNIERTDVKFDVDIKFSGRTIAPPNTPKDHRCLDVNPASFYYYTQTSGTLKGKDKATGAKLSVSRAGEAFQVGIGANVTNKDLNFGASGWLAMTITTQPSTNLVLELQTSSAGGNGDININLDGNPTVCFDSEITLECPDNITTVAQLGSDGKVVSWNPPTATTTCQKQNICSDKTLVKWDLDACKALQDAYSYNEFTPTYPNAAGCSSITASKVYRNNPNDYYHSCIAGVSGNAMCISGTYVDYLPENSVHTLRFNATLNAADAGNFSKLSFYAFSPVKSFFTNGTSKKNDYLRKYGIKVRKNGSLIFVKEGLSLSNSDFRLETIDFGGALQVNNGSAKFDFELVAYDPIGNNLDHRAWELDEIKLIGCCGQNQTSGDVVVTQTEGPASGSVFPIGMTEVKYEAIDECGNKEICTFKVTVEEPVDPCTGNGSPSAEVEGIDPDCGRTNGKIKFTFGDNPNRTNIAFSSDGGQTYPVNVADNSGMAMFSDLAPGTYHIYVRWGNEECAVDLGNIRLEDVRQDAGTACDDEDARTINDVISADGCTCEGTPIGEISLVCGNDIAEILQPGETGVIVTFEEPTASTTCGLGGLNVEQIEGLASGSVFPIGTTTIKYQVTDACDNMEMCSFKVVIEETPLRFELVCADDMEVTAEVGDNGAIITFNEPSVNSNCPSSNFTIVQTEGPTSGSLFPVGMTTVTFKVSDECGQSEECSFKVTVNPAPTGEIRLVCNDDIIVTETVGEADGVIVDYNDPTAATTCPLGGLEIERTAGPASGSTFPIGTTTVTYTAKDACGTEETCSFDVTVNPAPTGEIRLVCNDDIIVTETVGEADGVIVDYNDPTAATTCPLGGLEVERTTGPASGSTFPIGTTTVTYTAKDACGAEETCSFEVTVNPAPTGEITFICNDDIEVTEAVGDNGVVVNYTDPTATSTCPIGAVNVTYISGLASGSTFPVGTTTVIYEATDECGGIERCAFIVKVNPAPTGEITLTCADDQTITIGPNASTAVVNYDEPIAITSCELGGLNVVLVEGLPTGSEFPIGANTVVFEAIDACGEVKRCSLIITVIQFIEPCLNDIVIQNKVCDDNGTPTDPADDTYTFDVIVMRTGGASASYIGSYDNAYLGTAVYTADYDEVVTLGPFPAGTFTAPNVFPPLTIEGGLDINLSITDSLDANCTDRVIVESTGPCSNELPKVKVGDIVFSDENGNGIQDDGEVGIKDVFVQLLDENGEVVQFTTSGENGMYMFSELDPGKYQLKFMGQGDDLIPTLQDEGDNDEKDSDIDEDGLTEIFTLVTGFDDTKDAGFKLRIVEPDPARIGNQVFLDANENGFKDDEEMGINGVEVKLLAENGAILQTTSTADNGRYAFSVIAGNYRVMFGTPFGFNPTNQSGNATDGVDNDSDIDPATGMTELFTIAAGEVNPTIDAGFVGEPTPCDNVTSGGTIAADEDPEACGPYDAAIITNIESPTGGSGELEYIWLSSTRDCPTELTDMIDGANGPDYDPGVLTQTTYFVRCARRVGCAVWIESDCVVKKVDRCNNGGPVDCDAITTTVSEGIIKVEGLIGSNAKVEIIGAGTNWTPVLVCGDGGEACENPQIITDLPEGDYTVKVQLWGTDGSYCYTERRVTVDGGEPTCNVDGGTISTNDDTTDLCVGDNEPNIVNFTATGSNGTNRAWVVTDNNGVILNADAPSAIDFEGAGTGTCYVYYVRYENIEGLENGENINGLRGCFDKSNSIEVSRTDNCGDPTCEADGGTISTDDDTTDLCVGDNEPNIVNFTATGSNGTNRAWVVTDNNGTILNADAPSAIDFEGAGTGTCYVYYVRYENIEGLETGANIADLQGCFDKSNRIEVTRTDNCGGGEPTCDDVEITTGNGKINLVGLSGQFVVVKIHDISAGWAIIDECVGCEDPTTFNVPAGDYNVVIEFYRGFWNDKYCRRDVSVTVTGDNPPCIDNDRDNVCQEDDCDDNDASVGAKQTPGTSCDDGNDLTINDVILADGCSCAGEEDTTSEKEICIEREVFNTENCQYYITYGLYLKLDGYDEYYEVSDASFIEYTDGTALYTATAINNTSPNIGWNIEVNFGGRTTLAEVAPKQHNCLTADVNDYYFYETLTGKLTGINDAAGASMNITRIGPAFQLGFGANITHKYLDFGGGGWFVADMLTQPTNGLSILLNEGAQGQHGDININLSGDGTECIDGRDNSELDCANVSAIATPDGITISGLTAPIEIVKVFDVNWVSIENCSANCEETMTVAAMPGNYIVRANFYTANWVGACEVDIPVTVPATGNRVSGRNTTNINHTNTIDLSALAVFPNPASDEIFVNLKAYKGQTADIQVVNAYGQIVQQVTIEEISAQAIRLDANTFQNGLYHVSIRVDNSNVVTKKVLVNKQY